MFTLPPFPVDGAGGVHYFACKRKRIMSDSKTKQDQIAEKVEAAGLVPVRNKAESSSPNTKDEQLSLSDLVDSILSGDIKPEQIDDELKAWVNARIDVPYVPEYVEGKALDLVVRTLKSAIIELV